jgi:hypothetical protein
MNGQELDSLLHFILLSYSKLSGSDLAIDLNLGIIIYLHAFFKVKQGVPSRLAEGRHHQLLQVHHQRSL